MNRDSGPTQAQLAAGQLQVNTVALFSTVYLTELKQLPLLLDSTLVLFKESLLTEVVPEPAIMKTSDVELEQYLLVK